MMRYGLSLIGSVIGFFVVRYICAAWLGFGPSTATAVAGVIAGLNVLLLIVGPLFLPPPSRSSQQGPDTN